MTKQAKAWIFAALVSLDLWLFAVDWMGFGAGPATYELVVENASDREVTLFEAVEYPGDRDFQWRESGVNLRPKTTDRESLFYRQRGSKRARYWIGVETSAAQVKPVASIWLRAEELEGIRRYRSFLIGAR